MGEEPNENESTAAVLDKTFDEDLDEAGEEDRFSGKDVSADGEKDGSQEKSLEDLNKEEAQMKNNKRQHKKDRQARSGKTQTEINELAINELYSGKNKGAHGVLKQKQIYAQMKGVYSKELTEVPGLYKFVNAVSKAVVGFQLPKIKELKSKIGLLEEAVKSEYDQKYDGIIQDTSDWFIGVSEKDVANFKETLNYIISERGDLSNVIEDTEFNTTDRADYVKELEGKIEKEYEPQINTFKKKVNNLSKKKNKSQEEVAALSVAGEKLDKYQSLKKLAQEAITDSMDDLQSYDIELKAKKIQLKKSEAVEGKFTNMYSGLRANTELLKQYLKQKDSGIGYVAVLRAMSKMSKINGGIGPYIQILDDHFKDVFETIDDIEIEEGPTLDVTIDTAAESVKTTRRDLVDKYCTKEV